jgi:hypothetical protein
MIVLHSSFHCFDLAEILILHTCMFCSLHCLKLIELIHNCRLMQRNILTSVLSCCLKIKIQYLTHVWPSYIYRLIFIYVIKTKFPVTGFYRVQQQICGWYRRVTLQVLRKIFEGQDILCLCCSVARLFSFHIVNIILFMTAVSPV